MPLMIRPIPRIGSFLTYMIILFIYHKFITLDNNVHFKNQMIWCVINVLGIDMHFDTHFLNLEY